MSTNCISCVVNQRTGGDLLCDDCRAVKIWARRKKLYPFEQGWVYAVLTLKSKNPLSDQRLKELACVGKVREYEVASVHQKGSSVRAILRHESRKSWGAIAASTEGGR